MIKHYDAYPTYITSNIEWVKEIPTNWKTETAKHLIKRIQRKIDEKDEIVTAFRDGEVTLRKNRRIDGFTMASKEIGYQGVRKGDLLIHAMDGFAGAIGVSDSNGKCSPVCSVCIPIEKNQIDINYYGYLCRELSVNNFILSLAKGIRERSTEFRYSEFSNLFLLLPPLNEQTQIAEFLDYETNRIDTLIEKQKKLIELLEEKRQAVISQAVTKGLDPNVPMKDSGIEWLGEVPKHWKNVKLKTLTNRITKGTTPSTVGGKIKNKGSIRFLRGENIGTNGAMVSFPEFFIDKKTDFILKRSRLKSGDLLFIIAGTLGKVGIVTDELLPSNTNQAVCIISLKNKSNRKYVYYSLQSNLVKNNIELNKVQTAQPNLSMENVGNIKINYPPQETQALIIKFLDNKTNIIIELISKVLQTITLLQEKRVSLISAAVTGKIDVRDWKKPNKEKDQ